MQKQANPAQPTVDPAALSKMLAEAKHDAINQAAMQNISRVATLGLGAGVGLRGLYGLVQTLNRAGSEPPASIPAPITLDVPVARKKEENKRRASMKLSSDKKANNPIGYLKDTALPQVTDLLRRGMKSTGEFLTDSAAGVGKTVADAAKGEYADSPVGNPLYIPGVIGAGLGSGIAGYKLTDWLLDDVRKGNTEDELEQAKKEYEDALYGKTAEAIDELYDAVTSMQKEAAPTLGDIPGATAGAYLTYALGTPLIVGSMVYNNEKKQQRKKLIDAAQNLRRRMRHETSPPPVYINPVIAGEEKLSAEDKPKTKPKAKKKKPEEKPDNSAWLGYGLGGAGLGALGTAYGLASDQQVKDVQDAVKSYNPDAYTKPNVIPNTTGMTHYHNTLSPGAALSPFGVPVRDLLVKARSSKWLMDLLGTGSYHLPTPAAQNGLSGRAHYTMFSNGPIPAYVHQLKAKGEFDQIVPESLAGRPNVTYRDWMNGKLEKFLEGHLGERLNPFEVTTHLMPQKDQAELMRKFYSSGTPEEQAYRSKVELPGDVYKAQSSRYLTPAKAFIAGRNALKTTGITAMGAGAGALGGNWLYNKLRGKKRRSEVKQLLSATAGAGLGGIGAFLAGTEPGRGLVSSGIDKLRQMAQQVIPPPGDAPGEVKAANDVNVQLSFDPELPFNLSFPKTMETTGEAATGLRGAIKNLYDKAPSELIWALLGGLGGAAGGALYSPRHSPGRGAIMGGLAGLGAGAGLATGNSFMDTDSARHLRGTLYGQAPTVMGLAGLGGAAGLRAGRTLADAVGLKGRKEKGDDDLAEIDVLSNPELRDKVIA